ncbi:MAG: CRISPR-associated endonuclease Cas4g/Cas1g [Acidimicrobiales bacterium]
MSDAGVVVPRLVPARMVNEFSYCPRLFYLEWVQCRWEDNPDTALGRYEHRRVDRASGAVPPPDAGDFSRATSVELSSERLGLVARIDLLEGEGGEVTPVDTKKGSPPSSQVLGAYESDLVQVCVQALILRDNGYTCKKAVIYFAEVKRRLDVEISEELVKRTLELVSQLREVASIDKAPSPLADSPKCPRCSLVGICLPDETNALADQEDRPVRRLIARDRTSRPLYVTEPGVYVRLREGRIEVGRRGDPALASVRIIDVSEISVFGNAQVTTQVLQAMFRRETPVFWFSSGGWLQGTAMGLPSKHVELRRRQVVVAGQGALAIAQRVVEGKIRNSRTLLRRNARPSPTSILTSLKQLATSAAECDSVQSLLGIEGAAARLYFSELPNMIRSDLAFPGGVFSFDGRHRRPPPDAVNCLLSYAYALLVKDLVAATWAVGFDPYLGFYHRPRFGRPALALDLAEEFRPLIADSVVLTLINNGEIRPSDFIERAGAVALTSEGRRTTIGAYERRVNSEVQHPTFGYKLSYRRVLELQARLLGACLLGEVPDYVPFVTR